jgi:DNA-binding NarL/FixJ family response regulator
MPVTILVVEDHEAVRSGLIDWLGVALPGCRVIEATSGEEAVVLAVAESPQVVLMDIGLPGMNGIEATRQIKATQPSVHVAILTIHDDDFYRADATAAGASAYVPKRMMGSQLIPVLTALLGEDFDCGRGLKE